MDHDTAIVLAHHHVAGDQKADVPGHLQRLVGQLGIAVAQNHVRLDVGVDLGLERGWHVDLAQGSETFGGEGSFDLGNGL